MNSNQRRELEASNPEAEEVAILEEQLAEAAAADNFFDTASGKLWVKLATAEIAKLVKDVTSDKYLKDHMGYVNALSELKANRTMLRKMQVAASPQRQAKLRERLEEST